jgi:hypothetical protein
MIRLGGGIGIIGVAIVWGSTIRERFKPLAMITRNPLQWVEGGIVVGGAIVLDDWK